MRQFLGFGNGQDGIATLSGTDTPIDSACSGTSGTKSLSATNTSFAAGQFILIYQVGLASPTEENFEVNQIDSYVAGTITTVYPLERSYSGRAQVMVLKQYKSVTISSTFSAKTWNGVVGGIAGFLCQGTVRGATITASGKGFEGGESVVGTEQYGKQGGGTAAAGGTQSAAANGNGGGGGGKWDSGVGVGSAGPGAGGGNASVGQSANDGGSIELAVGGDIASNSGLSSMSFGGGGGSGGTRFGSPNSSGEGGRGGGIVFIHAGKIALSGYISVLGANGYNAFAGMGAGGGGAGGCINIKTREADMTDAQFLATGGIGGTGGNAEATKAGDGGVGRIYIEACSYKTPIVTPSPTPVTSIGGKSYCGSLASIIE